MSQVKEMCDELLQAKESGRINQDQLEYELAKLSLEMLGDYRPKQEPAMTGELAKMMCYTRSDWAAMQDPDAEKRFAELKGKHKAHCGHIKADNNSNEYWLGICRDSFKKNNNPKWILFQNMIADHQGVLA
jgi:hypothetical protein